MARILIYNLLVLILGLFLVELALGNWIFPDNLNTLYILKNVSRKYDVGHLYRSANGKAQYTRDEFGLRGRYQNVTDVGVVTLGGSTTDQRYMDDQETWQSQFENCVSDHDRKLRVANAGIDGQTSFGHIQALDRWLKRIEGLKPKYVIVYLGSNDFRISEKFLPQVSAQRSLYDEWFHRSALSFLIRTVVGNFTAKKGKVYHQSTLPEFWRWTANQTLEGSDQAFQIVRAKVERYQKRVEDLVERVRQWGATPILVAQWDFIAKRQDGGVVGLDQPLEFEGQTFRGMDHYHLMAAFHRGTRAAAESRNALFWDLAGELLFEESDMYDLVHNTPSGAHKIGLYMCGKFIEQNLK